ncbi:ligand of Numb protein X 2-like [Schistocerca nitens]|uniref:ligand of Numb protein X 2-like n=1 Tax=Schistocerca nitens TaxID=7011 RepID=UPI002118A783|nr:ligand of Numb protein X 2-like [Schistocerca nitens]XP_049804846.1 ligand of Numb protein X 2-like [Schistocerca nitens]
METGGGKCAACGVQHGGREPHVYEYAAAVDDDLTCHICLQPLVAPVDMACGHTFCEPCLRGYLRTHRACPVDRQPVPHNQPLCSPSSFVLRKLLEKLSVKCPNTDVCDKVLSRGDLQDHLKKRCPATVNPEKAQTQHQVNKSSSCSSRPRTKSVQHDVHQKGITRLPVLEGEISHIEIPRLSTNLGITIVGGADTALHCIVVQEVFEDGLISQDGRLRPGDQLIEINGTDMTNATHHQACQALRKLCPVLRLGVYRERIESYAARSSSHYVEEVHTVTLEHQPNQQLGVRLSGWWMEPGIFIMEIMQGSPAAQSGHLEPYDRILSVNGKDLASCWLDQASKLIQSNECVTLVIARKKLKRPPPEHEKADRLPPLYHGRTKSAPETLGSPDKMLSQCFAVSRSSDVVPATYAGRERLHSQSCDALHMESIETVAQPQTSDNTPNNVREVADDSSIQRSSYASNFSMQQKCVTIHKDPKENLGMRIGGGIGSNEGDIPIYIANIHPQGCVGRTMRILKGDILLNVNGTSLLGLTHTQAVAILKATVEKREVTLEVLEGPETSAGSLNFIPSWVYWQKLPRCLQFPKTVVLHRIPGSSLGFSIVGGEDPVRGPEAIHILFVVQNSPAAKDGKLRCGDRLLAVDGHSLENVKHSAAVKMLKQTGSKVTLEVVSWLGTEL